MVELANRAAEAAWKIRNLDDYDRRLERAARRVGEFARERETAALVIYEAVLVGSGRPLDEVREMVRRFRETFEDEEEALTIPRVSGIMNVEGDEWFFGDDRLRAMAGRLLGQFQHRVAQYNYVGEREVLKRWADSYDTRLFIRRRIYETEPVVGVVEGFDLALLQYLRVAAGGDTLVPDEDVARALVALGYPASDDYEVLARAESLALHLELPAPVVGALLEDIAREGVTDFPEPPREEAPETGEGEEAAQEEYSPKPSAKDRTARKSAREDAKKGEEPTRVQDPQANDAPGVQEESGAEEPAPPETGSDDAPGTSTRR
ncbi:MAG: hypothetical protein M3157_06505 [Actinomycetota bacterium]|nr:hypothetical protein [Actinomycetota bacterium]